MKANQDIFMVPTAATAWDTRIPLVDDDDDGVFPLVCGLRPTPLDAANIDVLS